MSKSAANSISAADGNSTPMRSSAAYGAGSGLSPSPNGAALNVGLGSGEMSVKAKKAECLKFSSRGPIRSAASPRAGAGDGSPKSGSTAFRSKSEEQEGHGERLGSLAVGLTPPPPATVVSISAVRQTERGSLNVAPAIAKSGRATPRGVTPIGAAGRSRSANNSASLASTPRTTNTARAHEGHANASGAVRKAHGYGSANPVNNSDIMNLSPGSHQRAASASNTHSYSHYLSISASVSRRLSGASQPQQDNRHNEEQPFRSEAAAGDVGEEEGVREEDFDPVTLKYDPVSLLINGEARHNLNLKKHQMTRDRQLTDRGTRAVSSERKGTSAGGERSRLVFLNASNNNNTNSASTSRARSTSKDNFNNNSRSVFLTSNFSPSRGVLMGTVETTRKGGNSSSSLIGGRSVRGGSRSPSRSVSPATARVLYGYPEIAPKENRAMRTRRSASLSREQLIQEERAMLNSMEKGNIKTTLKEMRRSISPTSVGLSKSCFGLAAASAAATLNTASPLKGVGNGAPPRRVPSPPSHVAAVEASAHNSSSVSTSGRGKSPRALLNPSELSPSRSRGVTTPRGTVVACDYATSLLYERNETAAPLPPKSSSEAPAQEEEESHQAPVSNCGNSDGNSDGGEPTLSPRGGEEDHGYNTELNGTEETRPVEEEAHNPNILPHTLSDGEVVSNWGTADVNSEEKEGTGEDALHPTEDGLVVEGVGANDEKTTEDTASVVLVDLPSIADCERTKQQAEDEDVADVECKSDLPPESSLQNDRTEEEEKEAEKEIVDKKTESATVLPIAELSENSDATVGEIIAAEAALADTAAPAQGADALGN